MSRTRAKNLLYAVRTFHFRCMALTRRRGMVRSIRQPRSTGPVDCGGELVLQRDFWCPFAEPCPAAPIRPTGPALPSGLNRPWQNRSPGPAACRPLVGFFKSNRQDFRFRIDTQRLKKTAQDRGVALRSARAFCCHNPHASNAANAACGSWFNLKTVCLDRPSALAMADRLGGWRCREQTLMRSNVARL
jgi:hypothetical protein